MAIEAQEAKAAGMIGYMTRVMVQASMPYRDPKTTFYERKNGKLTLTMTALNPNIPLPFGAIPRLVMAWIGMEAVRTKERTIVLGGISDFLKSLNLCRSGGKRGDIRRLRKQVTSLFSTAISSNYIDESRASGINLLIADSYDLWWQQNDEIHQKELWESTVTLGQPFFNGLIDCPVPVDMRALKALKSTPMAIDLYIWLTYRNSYLRTPTPIRWEQLKMQFGTSYARTRDFKIHLIDSLRKVSVIYPEAKVSVDDNGLIIRPSLTHVPG